MFASWISGEGADAFGRTRLHGIAKTHERTGITGIFEKPKESIDENWLRKACYLNYMLFQRNKIRPRGILSCVRIALCIRLDASHRVCQ
jgi:hypothetical protein